MLSPAVARAAQTKEQAVGAKTELCRRRLLTCILIFTVRTVSGGKLGTNVACDTHNILSNPDNCKERY